ncbi:hypothetical protein [Haloplanus sp. C73]|uniref:hypothetical protein n=1 Tax=Haloplanus sp. C73 TaxID=3421641 RepID=UPI003EC13255
MVFSVVTISGAAAAATNVSISPDDSTADATNVTYTAEGNVELNNSDTLQYVDVHLSPANVSAVGSGDITVYIDGGEYTDGITEFSASDGTVEFKLSNSQSLSDGDRVRVVVGNVTNPSSDFTANATLHDTGDAQFQEFTDSVTITQPANIVYDDFAVNNTSVDTGEDVRVSATVENTGGESGTYNASLTVDGSTQAYNNGTLDAGESTTTTFVTNFSSTGEYDVSIETLGPTTVSVSDSLAITGGSATPSQVESGTTVDNQVVSYDVTNLSQDGDTDVHYIEFPNALASGLSVNYANSTATSITSSANLVDGFDDDGTDDTVKFATSGDGGGGVDTTLSVDTSVTYATSGTYDVDVRTVDSDGTVVSQQAVTSVTASGDSSTDETAGGDNEGVVPYTGDEDPTVEDVDLTAHSVDVDLVVTTNMTLDQLQVSVSGPVDETFDREDFDLSRQDGHYEYTTDVAETSGTFEATVETIADDGTTVSLDQTDTLTVGLPGPPSSSAVAAPPWTGDSESVHTLSTTVPEGASVTGETLRTVEIGYSDAFLDAGGSVSSVSDDQNVATLTVVGADGTVKSRMGGTDAVTVNTDDGTVALNLADVDSSRIPTLEAGDRLVVEIRPVTNPEEAGTYETTLTLGTDTERASTDLPLQIRADDDAAFAAATVTPATEQASVDLTRSSAIESVTVAAESDGAGAVRVAVPQPRPNATENLSGNVVTALTVTRPPAVEDQPTTLSTSLSRDAFESAPEALTVARYDRETGEWVELDTTVAETSSDTVTLSATASETSLFAVTAPVQTASDSAEMTASDTDETTEMPADEQSTSDGGTQATPAADDQQAQTSQDATATATPGETRSQAPGFGALLAVLATLGAALLLARRD